jgi:predicted AlkP superfamily pyrophosphatase or phosphodiesterase
MRLGVRLAAALICSVITFGVGPAWGAPASRSPSPPGPPSLIVTLVIDQFSANLFNQYRGRFQSGLGRLVNEGLVHANGYQTQGVTDTCSGHSTVLSGMHPAHTGIPSNAWVDPVTGRNVYCLAEPRNTLAHGRITDNGPVGITSLKVDLLPDWLKATSPESRIFAVSGKDRGAITLVGRSGSAFWFTNDFGLTTYVEPGQTAEARLAPVAGFNTRFRAAPPTPWTGRYPDCQALASEFTVRGRPFRSQVPPAKPAFDVSPALDEATLEAAAYLIDSQQLGQRGVTDMLGVSLSGADLVGHAFGTQGPEQCELMHRLDEALAPFLDKLAALPGGALLVMTADHGGSDAVEREAVRGHPGSRRIEPTILAPINEALLARFPTLASPPIRSGYGGMLVADADRRALPDPLRAQVAEAAVELFRQSPDIAFAETRDRLLAEPIPDTANPELLTLRERMRLSVVANRSPDIAVAFPAGSVFEFGGDAISGHGTPWDYDRRVPIVFWWAGAVGQERFLPIRTIDIAPTLANVMGVQTPGLDGRCIDLGAFARPC